MKSADQPRATTKAEWYAEARRRGVEGRSTMTKAELVRDLAGGTGAAGAAPDPDQL